MPFLKTLTHFRKLSSNTYHCSLLCWNEQKHIKNDCFFEDGEMQNPSTHCNSIWKPFAICVEHSVMVLWLSSQKAVKCVKTHYQNLVLALGYWWDCTDWLPNSDPPMSEGGFLSLQPWKYSKNLPLDNNQSIYCCKIFSFTSSK